MAEGDVGHEENDFSPEFRNYLVRELYDSERVDNLWEGGVRWVFRDRGDSYPDLTPPNDHFVDFDPNLCRSSSVKIRHALHKLMFNKTLRGSLFQFWVPTKTPEGRTYLTVKNQPFAFGVCIRSVVREAFCQYRMGTCNLFCPDGMCADDEQLELPTSSFLHELPEFAYYLSCYPREEYLRRTFDSITPIEASWAVPVFENNSSICVGVLEIVFFHTLILLVPVDYAEFLRWMSENFREHGLSCLGEYNHRIMQCEVARRAASMELAVALKSASEIPLVLFALAWVSCGSCSNLLQPLYRFPDLLPSPYRTPVVETHWSSLAKFIDFFYFRKLQVIGSKLPISSLIYYSNATHLSVYKSLFGPLGEIHGFGGCFTMCLRSTSNTAELYVVQFFMSHHMNARNKLFAKFRLIMDTMKGYFKTFGLANGQEWEEELRLEVIGFQNGQEIHSSHKIPATGCTPGLEFLKNEPLTLQLGLPSHPSATGYIPSLKQKDGRSRLQLGYQPSVDSITNGIEAQNSNSPSLVSWLNGIEVMQVDSSDQKSHSVASIPAAGCIPGQWRQPSVDSVNQGVYAFTEAQNSYTLSDPSRDSLSNGIEMMQVDSSDQASVDPSNSFENHEQSMELNSDDRASAVCAFKNHGIQDANTVTIKAEFGNCAHLLQFSLSLPPRLVELQDKVAERKPEAGACDVFSIDKENGLLLIGGDDELQKWIDKSRLLGNTSTRVFLRPKQPMPT